MSLFDSIGAASNRAFGAAGNIADKVLSSTPAWAKKAGGVVLSRATAGLIPSDALTKERNLTELAELQGSKGMTEQQRIDRYENQYGVPALETIANQNKQQQIINSSGGGVDQNIVSSTPKQSSLPGWNQGQFEGQEVGYDGKIWKWDGSGWVAIRAEGSSGGGGSAPSGQQKASALAGAGDDILRNLNQDNVNALLNKQYENMDQFAAEIERVARENAERDYRTVLEALGRQKGEVAQLAGEQKENITRQGQMVEEELGIKSEKEQKEIDKQRTGFVEGVEETKDQLARNWRDMSLQVQRIMRGRGISDSTFASSEELKVLRDFNQGLRQLAVKKSGALKDFADAITETVSFYERKKVELAEEVRVNLQKVDQWVRQRTIDIQNQEGMALSNKLREINEANLRAESLRTNIKNEILQKQMDYDMWVKQTEVNYKLAVAQAAQGKVQSAADQIKEAAAVSKNMFTLLQNGQAHFVDMGNGQIGVQDLLTGSVLPTNTGFKDQYEEQQKLQQKILEQRAAGNDAFSQLFGGAAILGNQPQQEEEKTGLLGGIMQGLGF